MKIELSKTNERDWHQWFAWFPVATQDGYFIWLRRVWRRDECCEAAAWACAPIWGYRTERH